MVALMTVDDAASTAASNAVPLEAAMKNVLAIKGFCAGISSLACCFSWRGNVVLFLPVHSCTPLTSCRYRAGNLQSTMHFFTNAKAEGFACQARHCSSKSHNYTSLPWKCRKFHVEALDHIASLDPRFKLFHALLAHA